MVRSGRFNLRGVAFLPTTDFLFSRCEVNDMSASENRHTAMDDDVEWREAQVELEQARREYAGHGEVGEEDERAVGRRWLRLWRAERRRDELIRKSS